MGISLGSINTGLPPNIVEQLVEAERIPVKQMELKKGKIKAKHELILDLTQRVREIDEGIKAIGNTRGFDAIKLDIGDESILRGTADPEIAQPGSYQVEVVKLAYKTATLSNGFVDKDKTEVGIGYIRYTEPDGTAHKVFVDGENNTLEDVAKAINRKRMGIQASVIKDHSDEDTPYRLMISGKGLGTDEDLNFPMFYFLDGDEDFYIDKVRPAQNGVVKVDGMEYHVSENVIDDAIPGVALEMRRAAPGEEVTVNVGQDREVVVGKVKTLVESMNKVLSFIQQQNSMDENTDTSQTLGGSAVLRTIEGRIRRIFQAPVFGVRGQFKFINQLGISFQRNGLLAFDEKRFNSAVTKDIDAVAKFLIGDGRTTGFIPKLRGMTRGLLDRVTGPLITRDKSLQNQMTRLDDRIDRKERQLAKKEKQLRQQFASLEGTMSKLKSQGQFLSSRFGGQTQNLNLGSLSKTENT